MPVFVVVALSLAVLSVAAVVLSALQVKAAIGALAAAMRTTGNRLRPLVDELAEEAAVAATELEAIAETWNARRRRPGRAAHPRVH
ncbi:MAG TPA: hypothetical protein VM324_16720 [Egibacteraceae bacterium]|nr:hypothetical protein [Egibacteraceae bacterium]